MDSSEQGSRREQPSRRQLLRWVMLSAVGAGIVLASGRLANAVPAPRSGSSGERLATPPASSSIPLPSSVRVKVMYFQMTQAISTNEEHFTLQSPANFGDLLAEVKGKHPVLSTMTPSMMILVDGLPALPSTVLRDGDEVDFIPASAGG